MPLALLVPPLPGGDGRGEVLLSQEGLGACGGWHGKVEFDLEFPDEGGKFSGNGDDAFAVTNAARSETSVSFGEALLDAPRESFDFVGLSILPFGKGGADFWFSAVSLSAFTKHPAGVIVAALRTERSEMDRSEATCSEGGRPEGSIKWLPGVVCFHWFLRWAQP